MFPGTIIPPLPTKKIMGNLSPDFVEERRLGLQQFLNGIIYHPKLSKSYDLKTFLSASGDGLEAGKALSERPQPGLLKSMWGGVRSAWRARTGSAPHPVVAEIAANDSFKEISQRLDVYEGHLKKVTSLCEKCVKVDRARGYELARVAAYLQVMADGAQESPESTTMLRGAGDRFDRVSTVRQDQVDHTVAEFLTPMRYQLGKIGAVKLVMKNRDKAAVELQSASDTLHSKKRAVASARASGNTKGELVGGQGRAAEAQSGVDEAEARIKQTEQQVRFISQNLNKEITKFDFERRRDYREFMIRHVHSQVEYAAQERQMWEMLRDELR